MGTGSISMAAGTGSLAGNLGNTKPVFRPVRYRYSLDDQRMKPVPKVSERRWP